MTPTLFIFLSAAVFASAFVQGAVGIGFALITAPILGLLQPELLPVGVLVLMLPLNAQVFWRERRAVDWPGASWIAAGRLPGTFAGLWLLAALSQAQLDVTVGAVTVLSVAAVVIAPRFDPTRSGALASGLLTGVTETATGIGGPPLALLYQHAPRAVLRSTLALCFLLGEIISLLILALAGRIEVAHLATALGLCPAVILGAAVSRHAHHRISDDRLRAFVLIFATVSGILLIARATTS